MLGEVLASGKGRAILEKHMPGITQDPRINYQPSATLRRFAELTRALSADELQAIVDDLNRPISEAVPEVLGQTSLDELDRISYEAGPTPLSVPAKVVKLERGATVHPGGPVMLSLDGEWQMAEGGEEAERLNGEWGDAIPAQVPGSVHTALVQAGRLPDPTFGTNQKVAREESYKTWWFRRTFPRPVGSKGERLIFGGVCNRCTVWLNGHKLGSHEGMFGGPEFDVSNVLEDHNALVVRLYPAPYLEGPGPLNDFFIGMNVGWVTTVVFNNVYGWHYSNLPSLGIWRSVKVQGAPAVSLTHPFVTTPQAQDGLVDVVLHLKGEQAGWSGTLRGTIAPENFEGETFCFQMQVHADQASVDLHLQFAIPDPHLWWPMDLGEPDLYSLRLSFTPEEGGTPDNYHTTFGLRTVEMAPLPEGPNPAKYNWTFVINGTPHFVKGTNWCTMDPLMDFSRERYGRFLSLAAMQHVQMLRPWGSGMPETDEFYDLCDRKGIMVLQEWPTAWNSHETQPYEMLEETVHLNTLRLRNHPSLVMWGGGNESSYPFGVAIDMMGRLSIELDGTRPFHRGEPWGGSRHGYPSYWGGQPLDEHVTMTASFWGEFGLACMPVYESVQRYLPDDERQLWPPRPDGAFAYHTPVFNLKDDLSHLTQCARYFVPDDCSLETFTVGSQLSQAVGLRHTLELARTRWPECTGALYYKMNDNFPAASWATADWYGAPKIGHYVVQDAFAPLHACIILPRLNMAGIVVSLPVFLLDDNDLLRSSAWRVVARAYNSRLCEIRRATFSGQSSVDSPLKLGSLSLTYEQSDSTPLLLVSEVFQDGALAQRTFYCANYEARKGCLFALPRTTLAMSVRGNQATVRNTGSLSAVAVSVARPGYADTFVASDNYFWLDPGEEWTITVSDPTDLTVNAWNAG
jgi:beta-mannosidase